MFNVITHPVALDELLELPDNLRGRMTRLIERLEQEGNKMKRGNRLRKKVLSSAVKRKANLCCFIIFNIKEAFLFVQIPKSKSSL